MESGRPAELNPIEYQKVVVIQGVEYKIHLLPPSKAFKLATKLMKLIGEPFAAMAAAAGDEAKTIEVLPLAVRALTKNLHEDEVLALVQQLVATCTTENRPIPFESYFQGRLGVMLELTAKVVEVQFKDFFAAIVQAIADVKQGQAV